ncbi:hypothetical protein K1T71_013155 [Dendrolimus kikuchii]|uniref:Uncharacterized protein n=1 Tax=Dendrolimus kikuchii TaxID=765133 RepID=A0ACC1CJ39_9NEOP|nr:hypothetical protein K1T71_013155 [Dendrolimus kikuchii]
MTHCELLKHKRGHTYKQWLTAIIANLTLFTYGNQVGWVSPATKVLKSNQSPYGRISDYEISWVASSMCLAAVFGTLVFTYIVDRYGRKVGVVAIAALQALSWIIKIFSSDIYGLLLARIICGIPAGGCFNVIPIYVKEISQDDIRGSLGILLILLQNIGILAMYAMGAYVEFKHVMWIGLTVPVVALLLMLKAPESPAFLVNKEKYEEAANAVAFLRGLDMSDKLVQNEINQMKNEDIYYKSLPDISFMSILKNTAWCRGFLVILLTFTIAASNGNFVIVTYASTILSSSGVTVSPELQTLSFPVVMILASIFSMTVVEKVGRKIILATTYLITVLALLCLATTLLVKEYGGNLPSWLPVVAIIFSLGCYAAGVSPIPYISMSEMFNFQNRAKVTGFVVTYAWFMSFFSVVTFGPIYEVIGPYLTFYCFAGLNLLGFIVTLVLLPETKGKSVEEIEMMLRGGTK